ncbi:MAG TPA: PP2C family protein-serine/threonine phosphatase [Spirochaetota bacterium]|nr:PP2C family protein-serine/threonine phosphatase [Spirochaetota bacterium]HPD78321.1 PP2C family protein-serine/threonine phosphatase [Spirochaetota bacterium]HRS63007.1 PP2C family protein-serine/threonine phosphatase [Spirochaetota bacterium]HRU66103.1 PP2C family protein-serine/threonine phosphatase [Spirochaetota bacterium]
MFSFKNLIKAFLQEDARTVHPDTFEEELDFQCGRVINFASIITLSWLTYIPIDMQLHPDKPLIVAIRIGFPIFGFILFISKFFTTLPKRNLIFLTIYGAYMAISNAILTGVTKMDPAYIGGFLFILTLLALGPIKKRWAQGILITSLIVFAITTYLSGVREIKGHNFYSLNDLFCVSFILICFIEILNGIRYKSWSKARQVEIGEEIIKLQKQYSEILEQTVKERTVELERERNNLKEKNESMERDLQMAKLIHGQLMPSKTPGDFIHSFYKPMDMVGGDFYDFIHFRDPDKLGIFISDVSGHGLAAAFITSMVKTIILQSGEKKLNPADLLSFINEILYNQVGGNFVTAFYGIYDKKTRKLTFANAGHNPPYVISPDGKVEYLNGHKTVPLAIMDNDSLKKRGKIFKNSEIILKPNTKLLLYTDGFIECQPFNNHKLSFEEKLREIIDKIKHEKPDAFIQNIYKDLTEFRGCESFEDDVCLICMDIL